MEAPHPQQFGRDDEDEVAAGKRAFAEYTAMADKVHAAVDADDEEGRAAKEAMQVTNHRHASCAVACLFLQQFDLNY